MIRLEKVSSKNIWQILELKVHDDQKEFVATNTESIVEAYLVLSNGGHVLPFGIYKDETLVGFLMIGYGVDDSWENPPEIAKGNYSIWRFMIDKKYQHKGYGRKAMELALDYIKSKPCGEAEYCYLSYEPENDRAKALYQSLGFIETGDKDEDELIAAMKI